MHLYNPKLINHRYARWVIYAAFITVIVIIFPFNAIPVSSDNGFDLTNASVPRDKIYHGGPGRDGIPAIDKPEYVAAKAVTFLKPDDRVLGLKYKGSVRAYPVKILTRHEIVNDVIKQQAIVVTYCPLCGSGMAFIADVDDTENSFGVSGLLYNNDLLLYDRATESLWSQIMGMAISGKLKGNKLSPLVLENTSWSAWLSEYPDTDVLSTNTGYFRDYDFNPYANYEAERSLYYPVTNKSPRYHPKQRIIGVIIDKQAKAYSMSELRKLNSGKIKDNFAGKELLIKYDPKNKSVKVYDEEGQLVPATNMYWFAWFTFYPHTEIFNSDQ